MRTDVARGMRAARNSPIHSNGVINYEIVVRLFRTVLRDRLKNFSRYNSASIMLVLTSFPSFWQNRSNVAFTIFPSFNRRQILGVSSLLQLDKQPGEHKEHKVQGDDERCGDAEDEAEVFDVVDPAGAAHIARVLPQDAGGVDEGAIDDWSRDRTCIGEKSYHSTCIKIALVIDNMSCVLVGIF